MHTVVFYFMNARFISRFDAVQELDLERFEELFKTKAQGPVVDVSSSKSKVSQKVINKVQLLDSNRSKNLAITLRKANKTTEEICKAIQTYVLALFRMVWN